MGTSYSSHRAVTQLLTALGGNAATVPQYDDDGSKPAFQNFTMKSYRQEFEVGKKLLKVVYFRLVETKCETNRLLKEWYKSCLEELLQQDEAILPDPNYSHIERAAASDHITLKDMLDSLYKVLQPGASTENIKISPDLFLELGISIDLTWIRRIGTINLPLYYLLSSGHK